MNPNNEKKADSSGVSNAKIGAGRTGNGRTWFYGSLLLFTVIGGLTLAGIAPLRNRLTARASALHDAFFGAAAPAMADLEAEETPYPEEYKRTVTAFPNPGQGLPEDWIFKQPAKKIDPQPRAASVSRAPILKKDEEKESGPPPDVKVEDDEDSKDPGSETAGWYLRGEPEQEAYALLLKSYPKVEAMVRGDDSALKFVSWGGMRRSDSQYWVRLLFKTGDGLEEEYIWEVDLQSKKVAPLSHSARSMS